MSTDASRPRANAPTPEDASRASPPGAEIGRSGRRPLVQSEARFLLEASNVLASSLDWVEAISRLTDLVAPALADWCCIDILEPDEPPRRFCGGGASPERDPLLRELEEYPVKPDSAELAARAIASGEAVLLEDVTPEKLHRFKVAPRRLEIARRLGVRAALAVPITARGRVLGALTLVQSTNPFIPEATVLLARELGQRAGLSLDNALLYRDAQAASQAKSDFLAVMSHELRTPLNSILGYVDLIHAGIGGPVTEQQQSYLGKIRVSSAHLLQIIDEILTFSRMEAGRETLRVDSTSLATVFAEVVALCEPLAREQGLRFVVDDVPDATLHTDLQKLRQILLNLLTNAVKYTDEGWVRLAARVGEDTCEFVVADSGRGISQGDIDRIFEPFWQVEEAHTRSRGGTGLVLAVSRRLCRYLGGDLSVESARGKGTTFTAIIARSLDEDGPAPGAGLTPSPPRRSDGSGISSRPEPRSAR